MTGNAAPPELVIRGLVRAFGNGPPVLDGVDLSLPAGRITALLGPSGAGKTTIARCIAGLDEPRAGTIHLGPRPLNTPAVQVSAAARRIGMVFQGLALWSHRTVTGHLTAVLAARRVPRRERRERIATLLQLIGLTGKERRYPHQLSGGEKQRLAIARALAGDPALLILDEPLSGFEPAVREPVRAEWRRLAAAGLTTLLITHDRQEALALADQLAVLNSGRVEQSGAPEALLRRPATAFVARFLCDANLLPATINADGQSADTPLGSLPLAVGAPTAGQLLAVVRQHQLRLSSDDALADSTLKAQATVERCESTLDGTRVHLRLVTGLTLTAATNAAAEPPPPSGSVVRAGVSGEVWLVQARPAENGT